MKASSSEETKANYTINDGNLNTSFWFEILQKAWMKIDLPGVIVVTTVTLHGDNIIIAGAIVLVEHLDRLPWSKRFGVCSIRALNGSHACLRYERFISSCNVSCDSTLIGDKVRIEFEDTSGHECYKEQKLNEVIVHGYEHDTYNIWSQWGEWSSCYVACSRGIKLKSRSRNCIKSTSIKCLLPETNGRALLQVSNQKCFGQTKSCRCISDRPLSVNCSGDNFNSIPSFHEEVTKGIYSLYFNGNKITNITLRTFQRSTNLRELMLQYNNIENIDAGSFGGLPKLKKLFLKGNNIRKFEAQMFYGLGNLEELWLSDNYITQSRENCAFALICFFAFALTLSSAFAWVHFKCIGK